MSDAPIPSIDGTIEDVPYEEAPEQGEAAPEQGEAAPVTEAAASPPVAPAAPPAPTVTTSSPEQPAPKRRRVKKWTTVESASFSDALTREDDVFVSRLKAPLYILSPTVRLQTPLFDDDEEVCDYVTLKMKRTHLAAFRGVEDALLLMAKTHKGAWFGNDDITDDFLDASLKRFVDDDAKTLTVKVHEGVSGRTGVTPGTRVKVVLAADQAVFTRTQFGFPWTMHIVKSIENDEQLYLFDAEENAEYTSVSNDLFSHLAQDRSDLELADAL